MGSWEARSLAFTLAEVLITLAIIGVVAALTIPSVVAKYQKKQYYTQFMKMFNTINEAISLSINDNGNPDTWYFYYHRNEGETTEQYILPYLKVSKSCKDDNLASCVPSLVYPLAADGQQSGAEFYEGARDSLVSILSDGSLVSVMYGSGTGSGSSWVINEVDFIFDTNGLKGPNVMGRDIFEVWYSYDSSTNKWGWDDVAQEGEDCDPNDSESWGSTCSQRLLEEGKMDY